MEASTSSRPDFYGFLDRMRRPGAADLVRSVKSFIVSFSLNSTDEESDSRKVQDFLIKMETTIKEHQLWANATYDEIDTAIEGLEKFIMTKLFNRTFASSPEDSRIDSDISEKVQLLQHFIKPDHLDIPLVLQNEASWLFAVKELQKINTFKAPGEKLMCVMNCCHIINNLLLNASLSLERAPAGADEFLPILIYVTIKANPPQLHSNLKFIQLFRRESKLVSETEYYLTNLISAKTFLLNINSKSLSMDEREFQKNMQHARLSSEELTVNCGPSLSVGLSRAKHKMELINSGSKFPFIDANAEDLTQEDVKKLLSIYKQVVNRYTSLLRSVKNPSPDEDQLLFTRSPPSRDTN